MVALATRPPGRRTTLTPEATNATVMIGTGAISRHDLDLRMLPQPLRERRRLAVGQQRYRPPSLQVDQHRAVGMTLAQRPVVDAEDQGCHLHWQGRCPDQPQQRVARGRHAQPPAQTSTSRPTEGKAGHGQPLGQPSRPACPGCDHPRQPLREDPPRAADMVAEQPTHTQPQPDRVAAPGQIRQGAAIAAVHASGRHVAKRAIDRCLPRGQGQGDLGLGLIEIAGIEAKAGSFW